MGLLDGVLNQPKAKGGQKTGCPTCGLQVALPVSGQGIHFSQLLQERPEGVRSQRDYRPSRGRLGAHNDVGRIRLDVNDFHRYNVPAPTTSLHRDVPEATMNIRIAGGWRRSLLIAFGIKHEASKETLDCQIEQLSIECI